MVWMTGFLATGALLFGAGPDVGPVRLLYPGWDPTVKAVAPGSGQGAQLVQTRSWHRTGRALTVAIVEHGALESPGKLAFSQASGPLACTAVLADAQGALIAQGEVDGGCSKLDLAAYKKSATETLIGVREEWINHGFSTTTLTLLEVRGSKLVPVFHREVGTSNGNADPPTEEACTLDMLPVASAPNSIKMACAPSGKTTVFAWSGDHYVEK